MIMSKGAVDPRTEDVHGAFWTSRVSAPPAPADSRGRVLVITDGRSESHTVQWALRALHLESAWVRGGLEGIAALRRHPFDLVLVDEQLPDMSGAAVVRTLRSEYDSHRFVIVRAAATTALLSSACTGPGHVDALRMLDTPRRCTDVISVINTTLGHHAVPSPPRTQAMTRIAAAAPIGWRTVGSVAERWARLVLGTIDAESDPRTLTLWARAVGVSRSALSECCRLVHVSAHDARDFARVLRAICRSGERWQPEVVLDLADVRTLRKLLARSGLSGDSCTPTMPQFLDRQDWIPKANAGLAALRTLLFDATRYVRG